MSNTNNPKSQAEHIIRSPQRFCNCGHRENQHRYQNGFKGSCVAQDCNCERFVR